MRKIHENLSKMSAVNLALHRIKVNSTSGGVGADRPGRCWCRAFPGGVGVSSYYMQKDKPPTQKR